MDRILFHEGGISLPSWDVNRSAARPPLPPRKFVTRMDIPGHDTNFDLQHFMSTLIIRNLLWTSQISLLQKPAFS